MGKLSQKKTVLFLGAPLIHPGDGLMMFLPGSFGFSTARLVGLGKDAIFFLTMVAIANKGNILDVTFLVLPILEFFTSLYV